MKLSRLLLVCVMVLLGKGACSQVMEDTVQVSEEAELLKAAVKLIDSAKSKEALTPLKKAIKVRADFVPAYTKMGFCKYKMNDLKGAVTDFGKVLQIDPNNYDAYKYLGIMFYDSKNFKDAKVFFDSAAAIANVLKIDDAEFFLYRARLMKAGKSYKEALDMAGNALYADPKMVEAYILKAEIRFERKEYNYTIKELNDGMKLIPADKPNYDAYKLRAKAKFEVQDYKGAVTDWSVYVDAFPKEEEALISRAAARINTNDNTNAIVDLDNAIKLNPKNPVSYNYRGVAKGGNKQYVEALKDLDYAIKLKFDYPPAYVNRAAIKFASKDKHGACEDLSKADGLGDQMAYKLIEQYCKHQDR
ncbi:MAG: tetratricopeptide repeat protein [Bacteroidia bacterium]